MHAHAHTHTHARTHARALSLPKLQVLFKLLGLIIMFAYFHGVFVLPVVLSLIGPDPYPLK